MNRKDSSPSLDAALAKVNPDRRRFLGMMLAGAAALPLLTSNELTLTASAQTTIPAPTFHPNPSECKHGADIYQVAISDSQAGVTIYYTNDGKTPTTNSMKYTGPITVKVGGHDVKKPQNNTLKAIAVAGSQSSDVTTAIYQQQMDCK
jgi:hypothetical protein